MHSQLHINSFCAQLGRKWEPPPPSVSPPLPARLQVFFLVPAHSNSSDPLENPVKGSEKSYRLKASLAGGGGMYVKRCLRIYVYRSLSHLRVPGSHQHLTPGLRAPAPSLPPGKPPDLQIFLIPPSRSPPEALFFCSVCSNISGFPDSDFG